MQEKLLNSSSIAIYGHVVTGSLINKFLHVFFVNKTKSTQHSEVRSELFFKQIRGNLI
jgi:hypothetical protein